MSDGSPESYQVCVCTFFLQLLWCPFSRTSPGSAAVPSSGGGWFLFRLGKRLYLNGDTAIFFFFSFLNLSSMIGLTCRITAEHWTVWPWLCMLSINHDLWASGQLCNRSTHLDTRQKTVISNMHDGINIHSKIVHIMFYCKNVLEFFCAKEQHLLKKLALQCFWCSGLFPCAWWCAAWYQRR